MIQSKNVPLSLYIHLPWCAQKCPYCDFNSHEGFSDSYQEPYVNALLADLESQKDWASGRALETIFIGGGTPSLFTGIWIDRILSGVAKVITISQTAEITLESNPGSAEIARYRDYRSAGVTRLSIGVQSFDDTSLARLGRIHSGKEARTALALADKADFSRWNIDLMHGLPGQDPENARDDIGEAIRLSAGHISRYQLTIERNTRFWSTPPALPDEDTLAQIEDTGHTLHADARCSQYEVSAFCRPNNECRHNMNYWTFGDYLGIGAGAHGKLTLEDGTIIRTQRTRSPLDYLNQAGAAPFASPAVQVISADDLPGEFAMNALRLPGGVPLAYFTERTGLPENVLKQRAQTALERGWLADWGGGRFVTTPLGFTFLDSVLATLL
ncbi:MAG: radical SAM family heme chaperone HemW [Halieaceae bacterium]